MKRNRTPLVSHPQDESTQLLTLHLKTPFLDYMSRLRTFYGGASSEQIVENLVRYAAEKREHFIPENYKPFATDEPTRLRARVRRAHGGRSDGGEGPESSEPDQPLLEHGA